MKLYIKLAFMVLIFSNLGAQNCRASSDVSEYGFRNEADGMTFKQLRDYSLTDKEHYQQVVRYFQFRLDRLKNTPCPVLTKEWIEASSGKEFATGAPSFYSPSRLTDELKSGPITSVGEINWNITIFIDGQVQSPMIFNKADLGSISELIAQDVETLDRLGTYGTTKALTEEFGEVPPTDPRAIKYGPMVTKICTYYSNNVKSDNPKVKIDLSISDEFLELPELGIKGELIG